MTDLHLSTSDIQALRGLMAAQPRPGQPLPDPEVLFHLNSLIPSDRLGVSYSDQTGLVSELVLVVPSDRSNGRVWTSPIGWGEQHDGPFYLGLMHWRRQHAYAEACEIKLGSKEDSLCLGFRNGTHHVAQYGMTRHGRFFSERDFAMLDLIGPALRRLVRERPTPRLPTSLTITERRVLYAVAAGRSNPQIAEDMGVAVATVRKHLEHAYRKLGVTNRIAAIARMRGCDEPDLDMRERIERYA
jgi:DNA-binding CsgD family transcriptional regulator